MTKAETRLAPYLDHLRGLPFVKKVEVKARKPETPASEPAGARISAGKSGNVERSFPATAVESVNLLPVSWIPSPESPANRIATRLISSDGLDCIDTLLLRLGPSERISTDWEWLDCIGQGAG